MLGLLQRLGQSGLSMNAFSTAELISYEKLRYWKKKLNYKSQNKNDHQKQKLSARAKEFSGFVRIEPPKQAVVCSSIQITYPSGVKLSCQSDIGLDALQSLIKLF